MNSVGREMTGEGRFNTGEITAHKGANFSECKKYRYALWRIWDTSLPKAMCIGLNPSTANSEKDDTTIGNLSALLARVGYGGLYMVNLFALISSDPNDLRACPDPLNGNDHWLNDTARHRETNSPVSRNHLDEIKMQTTAILKITHDTNTLH